MTQRARRFAKVPPKLAPTLFRAVLIDGSCAFGILRHCTRAAVQKCPFDAIMIINLPKNLEKETTHRYGPNSFKLHRCWPLLGNLPATLPAR